MNDDTLLSQADREEGMSRAYVYAVASFVGYTISEENFDRDGVDLRIHAGGLGSPSIGLQLKATVNLRGPMRDGDYRYDVPIENYEKLIGTYQVPRYLVVLALPRDDSQWLSASAQELVLRRCAYWVSLEDEGERENQRTVTVSVQPSHRFDANALQYLIGLSRQSFQYNIDIGGNDDRNEN